MDMPSILSVLSDHGFSDTGTTRKVAVVNDVIWDICSREPWPFMEKSVSLTFAGGSSTASNYPTDVATVLSVVDNIQGIRLYPIRLEEFRQRHSLDMTQANNPYYYYFIANQFNVFPLPAATQTLLMAYIFIPVAITDTSIESAIALPPRFHSLIWYGALAQLFDMEDDPELATRFQTKFEQKFQTMRNQLWSRQLDKADTIEVVDSEDLWS